MENAKAILKSLLWRVPLRLIAGIGAAYLWESRKIESVVMDGASFLFCVGMLFLALAFWRYRRRDDGLADYAGTRLSFGGFIGLWTRLSYSDAKSSGVFQLDEEQIFLSRQCADVLAGILCLLPSLLNML